MGIMFKQACVSGKWDGRVEMKIVSMIPHKWRKLPWISIFHSPSSWFGQSLIQEDINCSHDFPPMK